MVIEDLDPRDFDPEHTPKGGANAWGLEDEESVYRGISALKKGPYTMVIDDTPVIKYKNPLNKSLGIYSVTVKVQHWKKLMLKYHCTNFIITCSVDMVG